MSSTKSKNKATSHHRFRSNLPVLLNVPIPLRSHRRSDSLSQPQISGLQKAKLKLVVLANGDQHPGGVEAIREKEESKEVDEGERKLLVLLAGFNDLYKQNGSVLDKDTEDSLLPASNQ